MITIPVNEDSMGQYDGAIPVKTSGKYSGRKLADDIASSAEYVGLKKPQMEARVLARDSVTFQGDKEKLFRSVARSYRELEQFRDMNEKLVEDYAGPHYQSGDNKQNRYVNLMNQAVDAYH